MTDDDVRDQADRVLEAQAEASDLIQFAVWRFLRVTEEKNGALALLGLELALLVEAARAALLMNEMCKAEGTEVLFGKHARAEYASLKKYRGNPPPEPKPKKPRLKVVK